MARCNHKMLITDTSDLGKYGYCCHCYRDMTPYKGEAKPKLYKSHITARRLGLWGKR